MEQRENIHPNVARVPTRNGAKREYPPKSSKSTHKKIEKREKRNSRMLEWYI